MVQCQPNRLYIAPSSPAAANTEVAATASPPTSSLDRIKATVSLSTGNAVLELPGFPWRAEADFMNNDLSTHTILEDPITIETTGLYSAWFVTCDPKLTEVRRPSYGPQTCSRA
jgi:hypothetical protein